MARPATAAVRLLTGEREPVRLATTANIDVDTGGLLVIDGVQTEVGDRVLVKDQTDGSENGIRTVSAGQWYRAADSRTARTMQKGTTVHVQEGTANAGKIFVFNTLDPVIGDTDIAINFYLSEAILGDVNDAIAAGVVAIGDAGDETIADVQAAGADIVAAAEAAKDAAAASAASVNVKYAVDDTTLAALDPANSKSAFNLGNEGWWLPTAADISPEIMAGDPRYIADDGDATGASGGWVQAGAPETGFFDAHTDPVRIHRLADRVFVGGASPFNGWFAGHDFLEGLSPLTNALHNWAPRDSTMWVDSSVGAIGLMGSSQSSKGSAWPGSPTNVPSSIGVAGFAINDAVGGQGWGGYFDSVGLTGSNFTVGVEVTHANLKNTSVLTPYNYLSGGADAGVVAWIVSGAGLDIVDPDALALAGIDPWDVNHAAAYMAFLSSYSEASGGNWAVSTAYAVGDLVTDPQTDVVYCCRVAHTSGAGLFAADRAAHNTYWKARPGAAKGIVFTAGAIAENTYGTNLFNAISMPERHMLEWGRLNGSGTFEASALIYADNTTDGSDTVSMIFGTEKVEWYIGSTEIVQINEFALDIATGKVLAVGGTQVVGPRNMTPITFASDLATAITAVNQIRAMVIGHGLNTG